MGWYTKTWAVAGYTFGADLVCGRCVATMFGGVEEEDPEVVLDRVAVERGVLRHGDWVLDSSEFPHVVLVGDLQEGDTCDWCGALLIDEA